MEIAWAEQDALRFPLCLSAEVAVQGNAVEVIETALACGNVVLADHGLTRAAEPLIPPSGVPGELYRPHLGRVDLTFAQLWRFDRAGSAAAALANEARGALPVIALSGDAAQWTPVSDLLASDRFATEFVVEMEDDRRAAIRFGDDVQGRTPSPDEPITATYRTGNGRSGNLGRDTLNRMVTDLSGISRVRNPLPASGGADPETVAQVKRFAPQAFRTQQRAVTEADWVRAAELHPEVQHARATLRWSGSWVTGFITVDRKGGAAVDRDPAFESRLRAHLERFRLAGYDIEVNDPVSVPLDLALFVCVKPGYFRADVKRALLVRFGAATASDGSSGFFHPDHFSFGEPLYLSRVIAAAMTVAGVASVEVTRFHRLNRKPNQELQNRLIRIDPLEILQLANDANFPERGKLEFKLEGGL